MNDIPHPMQAVVTQDWHDLTSYRKEAGYPKLAQPFPSLGKWRAAVQMNSSEVAYSTKRYETYQAAEKAAVDKIEELKGK